MFYCTVRQTMLEHYTRAWKFRTIVRPYTSVSFNLFFIIFCYVSVEVITNYNYFIRESLDFSTLHLILWVMRVIARLLQACLQLWKLLHHQTLRISWELELKHYVNCKFSQILMLDSARRQFWLQTWCLSAWQVKWTRILLGCLLCIFPSQ